MAASRTPTRLALTLWLSALLALLACRGSSSNDAKAFPDVAPPRLVLLYAPCTVSRAYLAPYEERVHFTPNLARFAREAVAFDRHLTDTGQSGPSYASLFTGTEADRHGVYRHPTKLLDEALVISEVYAANGYENFYWNGHGAASAELNYAQGIPPGNVFKKGLEAEDPRFGTILTKLAAEPSYKAFVVTNSTVAHGPYRTSYLADFLRRYPGEGEGIDADDLARYGRLYSKNHFALSWNYPDTVERLAPSAEVRSKLIAAVELLYKSGIERLDRLFGQVVDRIRDEGLLEQSLIVFTTDHGELLYRDHAPFKWNHLMQLSDAVLAVPLLIRAPTLQPDRYPALSRSIDVFPTMLGLSGIALRRANGPTGVDLSAALRGRADVPALFAYSHTAVLPRGVVDSMGKPDQADRWELLRRSFPDDDVRWSEVAIRAGDRSYRWRKGDGGRWYFEVFDLARDPVERQNLYDARDPEHQRMAARLREYKERLVAGFESSEADRDVPRAQERDTLRRLGYID